MEKFNQLTEEKKQLIINAAMEEFTKKGYADASTNVITRQAGISKGALFHYFGNKQKLYDYLMHYTAERIRSELLHDFPEESDLLELFLKIGHQKAKLAQTNPNLFDFLYRVFKDDPNSPGYTRLIKETMAEFQSMIVHSIDTSKFRDGIDLATALEMCTWVSEGIGRKYAMTHESMEPDTLMEEGMKAFDALRIMLYKETK